MIKKLFIGIVVLLTMASPTLAKLRVEATVLPVWIFAKNVAGDRVEVGLLIKSGTDPHEFSLRPSDLRALDEADLVLLNGVGLEQNFIRGIDPEKSIDTSEGIETIMLKHAPDPHIWLDPLLAKKQVENIARALSALDPEGEKYYRKNADAFEERLDALNAEISRGISGLVAKRLITYHESFNYFARRYGLRAYSLTGPHAETPLPGRMRAVYDIVRAERVKAVFEEAQFRPGRLKRLSHDLGVEVCTLDAIVSGEPSPELYETTMRKNLETILRCLGGK